MTILDTFYILFKSNADDVKKGMREVEKASKDTEVNLKSTNEQANLLGKSFVKIAEGIGSVAGAYVGFEFIKNGIANQLAYNDQLKNTADLSGTAAEKLKQMASAAEAAGGTRSGALSDAARLSAMAQERGTTYNPDEFMANARARYKAMAGNLRAQREIRGVFSDVGLQRQVMMPDAEYQAGLAASKKTNLTSEDAAAAQKFKSSVEHLTGSVDNFFTKLGTMLVDPLSRLISVMTELINKISESGAGTAVAGGGLLAAGVIGGKRILGAVGRAVGSVAGKVAPGVATRIGMYGPEIAAGAAEASNPIGWGVGAATLAYSGYDAYMNSVHNFGNWFRNKYRGTPTASNAPLTQSKQSGTQMADDLKFWMDKGYTKEQAAGIMANIMAESGGNPNAVGDSGAAFGLAQWHGKRAAAIKAGSGIDIYKASRQEQMNAIYWEMQHGSTGFSDELFRSGKTGGETPGGYFSTHFERPADKLGESIRRGQSAIGLASQYSGTSSVNINAINISAPGADADDIAKHIKNAVIGECQFINANASSGRLG